MSEFFSQHNFLLEAAYDGSTGLARALAGGFDIILLDVMIPVLDASTCCASCASKRCPRDHADGANRARRPHRRTQSGADDYLPKPFEPGELLARIRAVLRRSGHTEQKEETIGRARCASIRGFAKPGSITNRSISPPSNSISFCCWRARRGALSPAMKSPRPCISARPRRLKDRSTSTSAICGKSSAEAKKKRHQDRPGVGYMLATVSGEDA